MKREQDAKTRSLCAYMNKLTQEIKKRRTFAIISHPDAGKTTLTEKLLLFGHAIQIAGTVKARKATRYATSDWMGLEKQRGISVTTSVMQFPYQGYIINLLDTPGHADFSEDTYRTLTAVDSALMVIDAAKGVEERTIKLLEVCRLRKTPIMTFINKLDRDSREPVELLDEIERVLKISCAPVTWPIEGGRLFKGIYHLQNDTLHWYTPGQGERIPDEKIVLGLDNPELDLFDWIKSFREEIALVQEGLPAFDPLAYLKGEQTPVFFGTALGNFGVKELLDTFVLHAPPPQARTTVSRIVEPDEPDLTGFVFKIQANMDPLHHDRIAFFRICSGHYQKGMKVRQVRLGKEITLNNAMTLFASERNLIEEAWPGDIIGIHNHGTVQIGDTFATYKTENLKFTGIPYFAPELFRRVRLKNPLKQKALQKGLKQLSEEGATQVFKPFAHHDLILGAVGLLQFEVVAYRLHHEYGVECIYESVNIAAARWIYCKNSQKLEQFRQKALDHLALDGGGTLAYLAPTLVNLNLTKERWPDIEFHGTREHDQNHHDS